MTARRILHFCYCLHIWMHSNPRPFHLSMLCKIFSVFAEILPVRELEPTRDLVVDVRERTPFAYGMEHIHDCSSLEWFYDGGCAYRSWP